MRLTLGQIASVADKTAVVAEIERIVAGTEADLVAFPEGAMYDFRPKVDLASVAEPLDGPFVGALGSIARDHRRWVVAGMWESGPDGRVFNTVVVLDRAGNLTGSYRKIHLFDSFGFKESDRVIPGEIGPVVIEIEGEPVGLMTCYDLRFPELARALVDAGARTILIPAGWVAGEHKLDHWLTLLRARAIENTSYVAAACLSRPWYVGHSAVFDPLGLCLGELDEIPGTLTVEIDPDRVTEVRDLIPSLRHRRL